MPLLQHAHVVKQVLQRIAGTEAPDLKHFLRRYPELYLFMKRNSNETCFNEFEEHFGQNQMLQSQLDFKQEGKENLLIDLIQMNDYKIAKEMADYVKAPVLQP